MKKVSTQQTGRQYDYRIKEEKNKATARQVLISEEIFFIPFPSRRERSGGPVSILPREFQLCVTKYCLESRFSRVALTIWPPTCFNTLQVSVNQKHRLCPVVTLFTVHKHQLCPVLTLFTVR